MTPRFSLAKVKVKLDLWKDANPGIAEVEEARKWAAELEKSPYINL